MPNLTRDEPVLVVTAAGAVITYVGGQLVTHGIITDTQASAATQSVLPFAAAGLVLALGVLVRHLVTPARKVAALLEREGLLTDADIATIETVLADKLGIDVDLDTGVGDEHPEAELVGVPLNQARAVDDDVEPVAAAQSGGMNAGSPNTPGYRAEHAATESA